MLYQINHKTRPILVTATTYLNTKLVRIPYMRAKYLVNITLLQIVQFDGTMHCFISEAKMEQLKLIE